LFGLCAVLLTTSGVALAATSKSSDSSQGEPGSITDTRVHTREADITAFFWLPWAYYSIGIGGQLRFEIPIVPDGFIPAVNDEFTLEPSFGIAAGCLSCSGYTVIEFAPAVYVNWRFHFSKEFNAYGGLGLGVNIGSYSSSVYGSTAVNAYIDPCVGLTYQFPSSDFAFRAQLGREGLMAGFSFYL
jgi:hypothetical protein